MDAQWFKTFNALTQLRQEISERRPEAGAQHLTDKRRVNLLDSIDLVLGDVASVARLGVLLAAPERGSDDSSACHCTDCGRPEDDCGGVLVDREG